MAIMSVTMSIRRLRGLIESAPARWASAFMGEDSELLVYSLHAGTLRSRKCAGASSWEHRLLAGSLQKCVPVLQRNKNVTCPLPAEGTGQLRQMKQWRQRPPVAVRISKSAILRGGHGDATA
ncbi:MAG TPA: hypothetical protein VJO99_04575 [Burkholderiaceae bacterium]|nr:hypothetical protein [Burkholderiaceae bacterium]